MEVYKVDKKDFYTKGNRGEIRFLRKQLNLVKEELNKENLEGALALLSEETYVDRPEFNFLRINILIRLNRLDEALAVCNDKRFLFFNPIQVQKKGLLAILRKREVRSPEPVVDIETNPKETLEEEILPEVEHVVEDEEQVKETFNDVKEEESKVDKEQDNIAEELIEESVSEVIKENIEEKDVNDIVLDVDKEDTQDEIETETFNSFETPAISEIIREEEKKERIPSPRKQKKKKKQKNYVTNIGEVKPQSFNRQNVQQVKVNNDKQKHIVMTIEQAFPNEAGAVGAYVYSQANAQKSREAMRAFDNYYNLIHRSIEDISSLQTFQKLVRQLSTVSYANVSYSEESFTKYYRKK